MAQKLAWREIKEKYPNEWVALAHYHETSNAPFGDISGEVVAHAVSEQEFTSQIKHLPEDVDDIDIRFTGEILPDMPVGSMLWHM